VRYGFAIDQRTCIGCHACTVACKTEHEVPVGQFRTWVKYVESGTYPDTTRRFGVMRCNHCTDAPCVKACPTHALFTRDDGIVDFDKDNCIGCKTCMQACPYDAIYIDEETHTAAKCNFCAHRVDAGLEPACVVVCPTHSIWVGDLDDASSGIAGLVRDNPVAVRAPEQDTGPNVFYLGADRAVLDPLEAPADATYIYATPDAQRAATAAEIAAEADGDARLTLNTAHPRPWGWRVWTYMWTKAVGAGALGLAALAGLLGVPLGAAGSVAAPALAVVMTALTALLLVWDLKRPERFLYILLRPNPRSWLMWGSWVLIGFSGVGLALLACGVFDVAGPLTVLRWLALPAAALAAGYTAFLFGQAEGRDLWQSPVLFWHLLAQAATVGGGALLVAAPVLGVPASGERFLTRAFVLAAVANLLVLAIEYAGKHASRSAALAAHMLTRGRYARWFWSAAALTALAAVLAALGWSGTAPVLGLVSGVLAQPALLAYERVFVRAGQDVPLS
jgi:Fe-S-cluster-containing dehydrogenase component